MHLPVFINALKIVTKCVCSIRLIMSENCPKFVSRTIFRHKQCNVNVYREDNIYVKANLTLTLILHFQIAIE